MGQKYQPLGPIPNQRLRPNRDVANLALSSDSHPDLEKHGPGKTVE